MIDVHRNICDYRDYGYGILLEYWILLWIGYPLWLLRVGGSGLDNHFQPCLLSLSLYADNGSSIGVFIAFRYDYWMLTSVIPIYRRRLTNH